MFNLTNLGNAALSTVGVGLVSVGVATIASNLLTGAVEIVLGLVIFLVYELTPSK